MRKENGKRAVYAIDEDDDEDARPPGEKITRMYRKKEETKNSSPYISFSLQLFEAGRRFFFSARARIVNSISFSFHFI